MTDWRALGGRARRFAGDAAHVTASGMVFSVSQILLQLVIARSVTVAEFGLFASILALITLIEVVFVSRSGELALQYIGPCWVDNKSSLIYSYYRRLIKLDFILNISIFIISCIIAWLFSHLLNIDYKVLIVGLFTIISQCGFGIFKSLFIMDNRLASLAKLEMMYSAIYLIVPIVGLKIAGMAGLFFGLALATLIKTVVFLIASRPILHAKIGPERRIESTSVQPSAVVHSILRNALSQGSAQIDVILIAAVQGPAMAGIYRAAKTTAGLVVKACNPVWVVIRPHIIVAWRKKQAKQLSRLVTLPVAALAFVLAAIACLLAWWGDDIITTAFGPDYHAAAMPALILFIGVAVFRVLTEGWFRFLTIIRDDKMAGTLIYGLLLAVILVAGPQYGQTSPAAMAQVVSGAMALAGVVAWLSFWRDLTRMRGGG